MYVNRYLIKLALISTHCQIDFPEKEEKISQKTYAYYQTMRNYLCLKRMVSLDTLNRTFQVFISLVPYQINMQLQIYIQIGKKPITNPSHPQILAIIIYNQLKSMNPYQTPPRTKENLEQSPFGLQKHVPLESPSPSDSQRLFPQSSPSYPFHSLGSNMQSSQGGNFNLSIPRPPYSNALNQTIAFPPITFNQTNFHINSHPNSNTFHQTNFNSQPNTYSVNNAPPNIKFTYSANTSAFSQMKPSNQTSNSQNQHQMQTRSKNQMIGQAGFPKLQKK